MPQCNTLPYPCMSTWGWPTGLVQSVAGTHSDTEQVITHLLLSILLIFIIILIHNANPNNPKSCHHLMAAILRGIPWHLRGHQGPIPKDFWHKTKKTNLIKSGHHGKPKHHSSSGFTFFALAMTSIRVGWCVEWSHQHFFFLWDLSRYQKGQSKPGPMWLRLLSHWGWQPLFKMHGQLPSPYRGPKPLSQWGQGWWDKHWVSDQMPKSFQVQHRRW